jgi:hypothetical protein
MESRIALQGSWVSVVTTGRTADAEAPDAQVLTPPTTVNCAITGIARRPNSAYAPRFPVDALTSHRPVRSADRAGHHLISTRQGETFLHDEEPSPPDHGFLTRSHRACRRVLFCLGTRRSHQSHGDDYNLILNDRADDAGRSAVTTHTDWRNQSEYRNDDAAEEKGAHLFRES